MLITKSDNFDRFRCIAGKCPDSCCAGGWQIIIDEDSLELYRASGDSVLDERLRKGVNWQEEYFNTDEQGRCSMLNENGLCSIQLTLGEKALCDTCGRYPRHVEEYEDVREYSLSLSCPEAARIILERKEPLTFFDPETDEAEEFEDFDYLLYAKLLDAREVLYRIIQDRSIGFREKAGRIREFAAGLQVCVDADRMFDMDRLIYGADDAVNYAAAKANANAAVDNAAASEAQVREMVDTVRGDNSSELPIMGYGLKKPLEKNAFSRLFEMEMLKPGWADVLNRTWEAWNDELVLSAEEEIQAEQLMIFWIYTYFCGAVYDGWIYSKALLAICSTWWILQINAANSFEGGIIEAAYRYAREIEHSDENLNALEEIFIE